MKKSIFSLKDTDLLVVIFTYLDMVQGNRDKFWRFFEQVWPKYPIQHLDNNLSAPNQSQLDHLVLHLVFDQCVGDQSEV